MRPLTTDSAIVDPDKILTRMSALMGHFTVTSRIKGKTRSVWATARLGLGGDFEMMMNHTDYNLCVDNILLMKKRLQLPFTETICYLHFVKNTIDTDLVHKLMQRDSRNFDPQTEQNWVLYGKVP